MNPYDTPVTDVQKEHCALTTIRHMLTAFAREKDIPFEEALLDFAATPLYDAMFDYETEFWKEGPAYIRSWYDDIQVHQSR